MRLSKVAKELESGPAGEITRDSFLVHKDRKTCTVCIDPNSERARRRTKRNKIESFPVVVFPKPEDKAAFRAASKGVKEGGPAQLNPDAVGTLYMVRSGEGKPYIVRHVQSHFRTGKNADGPTLPRKLATEYGGWTDRAFRLAFDVADKQGAELAIPFKTFFGGSVLRSDVENSPTYQRLERFCDKEGLKLERGELKGYIWPAANTVFVRRR